MMMVVVHDGGGGGGGGGGCGGGDDIIESCGKSKLIVLNTLITRGVEMRPKAGCIICEIIQITCILFKRMKRN